MAGSKEESIRWLGAGTPGRPMYLRARKGGGSTNASGEGSSSSKAGQLNKFEAAEVSRVDRETKKKQVFTCKIGDFVHLQPPAGEAVPYVGRLLDLFEDGKGNKFASTQWLYRQKDVASGAAKPPAGKNEIFYAKEHVDKIALDTVLEVIVIEFKLKNAGNTVLRSFRSRQEPENAKEINEPVYFCSRIYDLQNKVSLIDEQKFYEIAQFGNPAPDLTTIVATSTTTPKTAGSKAAPAEIMSSTSDTDEEDEGEEAVQPLQKTTKKRSRPVKPQDSNLKMKPEEPATAKGEESHKKRLKLVAAKATQKPDALKSTVKSAPPSKKPRPFDRSKKDREVEFDTAPSITESEAEDEAKGAKVAKNSASKGKNQKSIVVDSEDDEKGVESSKNGTAKVTKQEPNRDAAKQKTVQTPKSEKKQERKVEVTSEEEDESEAPTEPEDASDDEEAVNNVQVPASAKKKSMQDDDDDEKSKNHDDKVIKEPRPASTATVGSDAVEYFTVMEEPKDKPTVKLDSLSPPSLEEQPVEGDEEQENGEVKETTPRKPSLMTQLPSPPEAASQQHQMSSEEQKNELLFGSPVRHAIRSVPATSSKKPVHAPMAVERDDDEEAAHASGSETTEDEGGADSPSGRHQNKADAVREAPTDNASESRIDIDEKLWDLFRDLRVEIGEDEALEILGYLKLEHLINNEKRALAEQICPPPFILGKMNKPNVPPLLARARSLLGLKAPKTFSDAMGVRRAFAELERCRPGTIFGLLGHAPGASGEDLSSFKGTWLFPSQVTSPIFGTVLGLDGFRTFKMTYQRQPMYVPIDRDDGTVAEAAMRGFGRLVSPSFSFSLIRTGDCEFEVAPSPDETCDQIFVKTVNGRILSLFVPIEKAKLGFVKVIVGALEGLLPHQQRFVLADKQVGGEDEADVSLADCKVKPYSTLHLVLRLPVD